ncbi:HxlR family transcriptional regulator [Nocardioides gansuensis]|uniref:HxlR family transcriptional regulator n=1 Tax=Nocardioides gansuensis TaxID=2138300 RepID=A0A2T8F6L1_9ACTN|nr:winged helix-turn-helix transcriptional regulator [Nocardioides gansuensis]PVG81345.1 HxlR family transcriptional regulator [Nocardioides gansuensis]
MRHEDLADADCGIAQALGVVGDWQTLLVVRECAAGVTRFDALHHELGISRRALAEKLARLVEHGILERRPYSDRPPRHDYVLTAKGEGLLPVLVALQEFGTRHVMGDGSVSAAPATAEVQRLERLTGTRLPPLELVDHHDGTVRLPADRPTVLFFFPGAWPPDAHGYPPGWGDIPGARGCTLECLSYARAHDDFTAAGVQVVGVSTQRPDQLAGFAEHAGLPYLLASDQDGRAATTLRLPVFRTAGVDRLKRVSLLVGEDGVVRHVQAPVTDPAAAVDEMLALVSR